MPTCIRIYVCISENHL
ncbi:serum response factor-binding protein 1, partial [Trichinella spiralis]